MEGVAKLCVYLTVKAKKIYGDWISSMGRKEEPSLVPRLFFCSLPHPTLHPGNYKNGSAFGRDGVSKSLIRLGRRKRMVPARRQRRQGVLLPHMAEGHEARVGSRANLREKSWWYWSVGITAEELSLNIWELGAHWPSEPEPGKWTVFPQWEEHTWVCGYRCLWAHEMVREE